MSRDATLAVKCHACTRAYCCCDLPTDQDIEESNRRAVERLQRDLAQVCAADSERLLELGFRFDLCDREPGHPGFHEFISLGTGDIQGSGL